MPGACPIRPGLPPASHDGQIRGQPGRRALGRVEEERVLMIVIIIVIAGVPLLVQSL